MKEKYVGVVFAAENSGGLFEQHYIQKASTARYAGHCIWGMEDRIGHLPPHLAIQLYMARVDCHLIHACEVMPDAKKTYTNELRDVQKAFLRHVLMLHGHSALIPLYTETGVMPLDVRRFLHVLSNLQYYLNLTSNQLAHVTLNNAFHWAARGKPNWWTDVVRASRNLPFTVSRELEMHLLTPEYVGNYMTLVRIEMEDWLTREIETGSDKLYLLRGRVEPRKKEKPIPRPLCLRHYLAVNVVDHRRAITNILLSHHHLAVEEMRHTRRGHDVPREHRLCRFCESAIETPEHALLSCTANAMVVAERENVMPRFLAEIPGLDTAIIQRWSDVAVLQWMVFNRSTMALLASYAHRILQIFYAHPMYQPTLEV